MVRNAARERKGVSVRIHLIIDFCIATALVVVLVLVNASSSFTSARRSAEAEVSAAALSQASDLQSEIAAIPAEVRPLVDEPGVRRLDPRRCTTELHNFAKLLGSAQLFILDDRGRIACSDGSPPPRGMTDQRVWVADVFSAKGRIGGPLRDSVRKIDDAWFSTLFTTETGRQLALVGLIPAATLIGPPDHGIDVYLANTDTGRIFSTPASARDLLGSRIAAGLDRLLRVTTPRTLTLADGRKRLVAGRKVPHTDWAVVTAMPYTVATAPARGDLYRNLGFGGLVVLVLLGLGLLQRRRVSRPLQRLRRAMTDAGSESRGRPAPVSGPREFRTVAQAYNDLLGARVREEARFRALARYDSDFVTIVDAHGVITYANPRAVRTFALDHDSARAPSAFIDLVATADRNHVVKLMREWIGDEVGGESFAEFRLVTSTDAVRYVEATVQNLIADASVAGLIITCYDITERKAAEERLAHAALHDALTGLPNRPLVMDRLEHVLARGRRDGSLSAVLFLDLDSFKLINDTAGHGAGDDLLVQVAERLSALLRPGDTLGRFGGDEFVIICDEIGGVEEAQAIAERLVASRAQSYLVNGQEISIGGSIGIALASPGDSPSGLLRDADLAMYRAKAAGRGSVCVFDDAMRVETHYRLDIENALLRALDRGELSLHYQPLLSLDDGRPVNIEALLRWTTCDGTSIRPDEFIPVAEETGLIVPIGAWVIDEGCRQLAEWTVSGAVPADVALSVNVSARQLIQPGFASTISSVLDRHDIPPSRLVIEITESTVMQDTVASLSCLMELRALGFRISVDDFGTGYSSLGYLQRLPIDELKIDRAFVSPLATGTRACSIVESIVALGHALGLTVIAEGVETREQLQQLRRIGCDLGQGYLFTKPLPAEQIPEWLRARRDGPRPRPAQRARRSTINLTRHAADPATI